MKRLSDNIIPDIKNKIEIKELATPRTMETWCGTTNGATSGFSWDQKKSFLRTNSFSKLFIKTSIKNYFQIGAFSTTNGGVSFSALTGKFAADMLTKQNKK